MHWCRSTRWEWRGCYLPLGMPSARMVAWWSQNQHRTPVHHWQLVWEELAPFADKKALKAARLLDIRAPPKVYVVVRTEDF